MSTRLFTAFALCAFLVPTLSAQVTTHTVQIGNLDSLGCQNSDNPPTLSNHTRATAQLLFTYNAGTALLSLRVTNTSPVTVGVPNPVITEIGFNPPVQAVTGVTLQSQTGSGGATPTFTLTYDPQPGEGDDPNQINCFGSFGVLLDNGSGVAGAIANAAADTLAVPPSSAVIGPVNFVMRLTGPGVSSLTARTIAYGFSENRGGHVNVAVKFQAGGRGGEGSGAISNAPDCAPGMFLVGTPRINNPITVCASAGPGCHGCVPMSLNPGPITVLGVQIPIGLPIIHGFDVPANRAHNPLCVTFNIPNNPALRNVTVYFVLVVAHDNTLQVSDQLRMVIQ